jgi:hypothetical protein
MNGLCKCPACKGTGKMGVAVEVHGDGPVKKSGIRITCVYCEGHGTITHLKLSMLHFEQNMWCKCPDREKVDPVYYDDGQHPLVSKHHWRCFACGGVVQIG